LIQALRGQGLSEKWAHTDPFGWAGILPEQTWEILIVVHLKPWLLRH
jgi:hypothetical protein